MKNNFIVCMTPLQALIAKKITELKKGEKFNLLYISYYNYNKNIYYFNKINPYFKSGSFIFLSKNKFFIVYFILKNLININKYYDDLYIATLHDKYCQFIAAKFRYRNLKTFDDGFGNINPNGIFYKDENLNFSKYIFFKVMGFGYTVEQIRKKTKEHISIYKNMKNISSDITNVNIIEVESLNFIETGKELRFFLGQPLFEINNKYNDIYINRILEKLKVNIYMPHPAEKYRIKGNQNIEVIDTELIVEDYIQQIIDNHDIKNIKVYGFFSSALFNLKEVEGIQVYSLYNKDLYEDFNDIYNFIKSTDIKMMEI